MVIYRRFTYRHMILPIEILFILLVFDIVAKKYVVWYFHSKDTRDQAV